MRQSDTSKRPRLSLAPNPPSGEELDAYRTRNRSVLRNWGTETAGHSGIDTLMTRDPPGRAYFRRSLLVVAAVLLSMGLALLERGHAGPGILLLVLAATCPIFAALLTPTPLALVHLHFDGKNVAQGTLDTMQSVTTICIKPLSPVCAPFAAELATHFGRLCVPCKLEHAPVYGESSDGRMVCVRHSSLHG